MANADSQQTDAQQRALRRCLGKFATGVTVVTCTDRAGRSYGMTVNSFSSVSLDPPLVLWNIAKSTDSLQAYLNADKFAINVLTAGQGEVSRLCAQSDHTLFDKLDSELSAGGLPLLPGSLAYFECSRYAVHDCGDHYIIIGKVDEFRFDDGDPLLFFDGHYRTMGPDRS